MSGVLLRDFLFIPPSINSVCMVFGEFSGKASALVLTFDYTPYSIIPVETKAHASEREACFLFSFARWVVALGHLLSLIFENKG